MQDLTPVQIVFGNTISYPDLYPGISLLYTLERNELKEEVVLSQKPSVAAHIPLPAQLGWPAGHWARPVGRRRGAARD